MTISGISLVIGVGSSSTRSSSTFAASSSGSDKITVADLYGEILIEHTRPAPGITYVGNGRPRGPRPKTTEPSPKS